LGRDLLENRSDHLARTAPGGPEVDEDGLLGLQYVLDERRVGDGDGVLVGHGCLLNLGMECGTAGGIRPRRAWAPRPRGSRRATAPRRWTPSIRCRRR